jgi:hypothetical protein
MCNNIFISEVKNERYVIVKKSLNCWNEGTWNYIEINVRGIDFEIFCTDNISRKFDRYMWELEIIDVMFDN